MAEAKSKGGRPPFVPTEIQRTLVTVLRAIGEDPADIAREIGCDKRTLYKYFRQELAHGKARVRAKIGMSLVKKAIAGDNTAMIFWLKTQGGDAWREKPREPPEGGVPPTGAASELSDGELADIVQRRS